MSKGIVSIVLTPDNIPALAARIDEPEDRLTRLMTTADQLGNECIINVSWNWQLQRKAPE